MPICPADMAHEYVISTMEGSDQHGNRGWRAVLFRSVRGRWLLVSHQSALLDSPDLARSDAEAVARSNGVRLALAACVGDPSGITSAPPPRPPPEAAWPPPGGDPGTLRMAADNGELPAAVVFVGVEIDMQDPTLEPHLVEAP